MSSCSVSASAGNTMGCDLACVPASMQTPVHSSMVRNMLAPAPHPPYTIFSQRPASELKVNLGNIPLQALVEVTAASRHIGLLGVNF